MTESCWLCTHHLRLEKPRTLTKHKAYRANQWEPPYSFSKINRILTQTTSHTYLITIISWQPPKNGTQKEMTANQYKNDFNTNEHHMNTRPIFKTDGPRMTLFVSQFTHIFGSRCLVFTFQHILYNISPLSINPYFYQMQNMIRRLKATTG